MVKKIFIGLGVIFIIFVIFFFYVRSQKTSVSVDKNNLPSSTNTSTIIPTNQTLSTDGFIICLNPKDPSSSDCVLGLELADGKTDYGLIDQNGQTLSLDKFTTGSKINLKGFLVKDSFLENKFKIVSTLQVTQ